jgi:hypothetical protein
MFSRSLNVSIRTGGSILLFIWLLKRQEFIILDLTKLLSCTKVLQSQIGVTRLLGIIGDNLEKYQTLRIQFMLESSKLLYTKFPITHPILNTELLTSLSLPIPKIPKQQPPHFRRVQKAFSSTTSTSSLSQNSLS